MPLAIGPRQDVLKPDIQWVRTHWNRGFMAFQLGPGQRGRPRRVVDGVGVVAGADGAERGPGGWGRAGREFGINGGSSGKDGVITIGDHRRYSLSYVE